MGCNFVYFLLFDSIVKIGITSRPHTRRNAIMNELINMGFVVKDGECDYLILIPNASYQLESRLHNIFKDYLIQNKMYPGEWFRFDGLLKKFVTMYQHYENMYGVSPNIDLLIFDIMKNQSTLI